MIQFLKKRRSRCEAQAANIVVDLIAADQFLAGITLTLVSTWCVSAYYLLSGWQTVRLVNTCTSVWVSLMSTRKHVHCSSASGCAVFSRCYETILVSTLDLQIGQQNAPDGTLAGSLQIFVASGCSSSSKRLQLFHNPQAHLWAVLSWGRANDYSH